MSRQELEKLAEKYGMDIGKLERLSQHVTSPSIKNNSAVRSVRKEDGEEEVSVMVRAFFSLPVHKSTAEYFYRQFG